MGRRYGNRDIVELDRRGGYYASHVEAMTAEGLHSKSAIAAELAWRDAEIDRLRAVLENGRPATTFDQAWARMEAAGYQYGHEALEQVRLGWELAHGMRGGQ